jgi:hypothetical protein
VRLQNPSGWAAAEQYRWVPQRLPPRYTQQLSGSPILHRCPPEASRINSINRPACILGRLCLPQPYHKLGNCDSMSCNTPDIIYMNCWTPEWRQACTNVAGDLARSNACVQHDYECHHRVGVCYPAIPNTSYPPETFYATQCQDTTAF